MSLDYRLAGGLLFLFLGLGTLVLGGYHAFAHGTCSTTGYSPHYGPVPHCAKGIGWWAGLLVLGIFVAIGGAAIILMRGTLSTPPPRNVSSTVAAVLAGAIGVGGAFGVDAGINGAIGKAAAPSTAIGSGSGVVTLSPAQVRAHRVAICKDLVTSQTLLSAGVKNSLISQCQADPAAAQRRLRVESKAAFAAHAIAQCKQGVSAGGLPASARATLAAQCATSVKSGGTASTAATAATLCQQIVKAQVPPAAQQQALASCPKP